MVSSTLAEIVSSGSRIIASSVSSTELSAALALASWPLAASKIAIALQGGQRGASYRGGQSAASEGPATEGTYYMGPESASYRGGQLQRATEGLLRGPATKGQRGSL